MATKVSLKLLEIKDQKEKLSKKLQQLSFAAEILEREKHNSSVISPERNTLRRSKSNESDNEEALRKHSVAQTLVHRLQAEKKERERKRIERQRRIEEIIKYEMEMEAKRAREISEERIRKLKEESMQKHKQVKEQRQKELEELKIHQQKMKMIPEHERLYKKLEERYEKEVMLPMLEQKKQELAKKRGECRKISTEEISEHYRKYRSIVHERTERRKEELEKRLEEENRIRMHQKELRSSITEQIQKQYNEFKERQMENQQRKKSIRNKMVNYASLVKELKPVTVDELKVAELKKQIESLKHPVRQPKDPKDIKQQYDISKIRRFKTPTRGSKVNQSLAIDATHAVEVSVPVSVEVSTSCDHGGRRKSSNTKYKPDYLQELRKRRGAHSSLKPYHFNWEADFKNNRLNEAEKCMKIIEKAGLIEERARMKEKILEARGGAVKNFEMGESVSDMLLDSIKAKLAVLENLQYFLYILSLYVLACTNLIPHSEMNKRYY
eukprot:TRINITY_DN135082_c1_g1_i1.p1 TRINITY_DN135082_c1_g1~~TRINITY_DN135082_c1_g1_i1.p1  ORF type:complete len:497 (-),score=94.12 TRINITY_DN135082_c1_g1_i1:2746-4236(-)